jgi:hypothetical protein
MDLERMLDRCRRHQWHADDLDWTVAPKPMTRDDEIAICQYFTDMAGIERIAGRLFAVQRDNAETETLRAIFESFVVDEERHAVVALRLARHYDVHHYQRYEKNPSLVRFAAAFEDVVQHVSPEIANVYITSGEILLDIALLRSLNDYVDDAMSHQAMHLINRDESRHIAIDHHMVEYYASAEYKRRRASRPEPPLADRLKGAAAFSKFLFHARPFLKAVFFEPMDRVDPTGARLIEAFRRIQLVGLMNEVQDQPFNKFLRFLQDTFVHPIGGRLFGPLVVRIMGVDPRVIHRLYTEEDERRLRSMSFSDLAEETLAMKGEEAA